MCFEIRLICTCDIMMLQVKTDCIPTLKQKLEISFPQKSKLICSFKLKLEQLKSLCIKNKIPL